MTNGIDPGRLSAAERLDEVAAILAAGILRLRTRHAGVNPRKINSLTESSLDFPAERSVCRREPAETGENR